MAIVIRDGANGSMKSAACVVYDIIPALEAGRTVITNVEGLLPLEEIKKVTGKKFPASARLIRCFSCNKNGVNLWQNWFSWIPPDCLIVIDEAQDIFSKVAGFSADKSLYVGMEPFLPMLPEYWPDFFAERLASYKENYVESASDVDDFGERLFDENGNPNWPEHFMSACKRHRKFTWDMIWLTPDISDIPSDVRGAAELAKNHRNKSIPVFYPRRCRVWERTPKATGVTPPKGDTTYVVKIPLWAFGVYRSTFTGKFTKSGLSSLPRGLRIALLVLFMCVVGFIYALSDSSADVPDSQPSTDTVVSETVKPSVPVPVKAAPVVWTFNTAISDVFYDLRSPEILSPADFFARYMNISEQLVLKGFSRYGTRFSVVLESNSFFVGSDELSSFGIVAAPIPNQCAIALRSGNTITVARCDISKPTQPKPKQPEKMEVKLL